MKFFIDAEIPDRLAKLWVEHLADFGDPNTDDDECEIHIHVDGDLPEELEELMAQAHKIMGVDPEPGFTAQRVGQNGRRVRRTRESVDTLLDLPQVELLRAAFRFTSLCVNAEDSDYGDIQGVQDTAVFLAAYACDRIKPEDRATFEGVLVEWLRAGIVH